MGQPIHLAAPRIGLLLALAASGCDRAAVPAAPTPPAPPAAAAVEAALEAAERSLDAGEQASALVIAEALSKKAPQEWRAHEILARIHLARAAGAAAEPGGEAYAAAYAAYRRAAELRPGSAALHQAAGAVALSARRGAEALEHFRAAMELAPLDPQPPLYAALVHLERRELDQAEGLLARVLAIDPQQPQALASSATLALERGQPERAVALIEDARRADPADPDLKVTEARIHRRRGDPRRALELLVGLPPAHRVSEPVTREIAAAADAAGVPRVAAEAWTARFEAGPVAPDAWRTALRCAEAWLLAGDTAQARAWLDRAGLLAPAAEEVEAVRRRLAGGE